MTLSITATIPLSSGYSIPRLGFGVYQNFTTKQSCLQAFQAGYRHVDSAQAYRNEAAVGEAVHESGIPRGDLFITTKIATKSHSYEKARKGIDDSLARFQFANAFCTPDTDYIDLFLIHDPFAGKERRLETYRALQEAKQAGKIRTVGVSNYNVKHLEEIRQAGYEMPSVNQIELHPLCQQRPIVAYCKEHSIVVEAYCPLIRGRMGHPTIVSLATKHDRDPAQILLRWSLQKGYVPLPKSATPSRIISNIQLYDFELPKDDMAALDSLDRGKEGAISWNPIDAE